MKILLALFLSLNLMAQEPENQEKPMVTDSKEQEEEKVVGPCDYTYEIANLIFKERWNDLTTYLKFPIDRDYPFKPMTREQFLKNPTLLFEKDMFAKGVKIKETPQGCMLNNGVLWTTKEDQKKIIRVNFETASNLSARISATSKQLKLLPDNWKNSKLMLSCVFNKNDYHVFKNPKTGKYLLLVANGEKILQNVPAGTFRKDDTGIRYFRFDQDGTLLTLADNIRESGYYLNLKPKNKEEMFFKCSESNT